MKVIIESPYAAKSETVLQENIEYAKLCVKDSLDRGEAPIAFHLLYTLPGILNDRDLEQRKKGLMMSQKWYCVCDKVIMYVDRGTSEGMILGEIQAHLNNKPVEIRRLFKTT